MKKWSNKNGLKTSAIWKIALDGTKKSKTQKQMEWKCLREKQKLTQSNFTKKNKIKIK